MALPENNLDNMVLDIGNERFSYTDIYEGTFGGWLKKKVEAIQKKIKPVPDEKLEDLVDVGKLEYQVINNKNSEEIKNMYESVLNSWIGRQINEILDEKKIPKPDPIDHYKYVDLGKKIFMAVIKTKDNKTYLLVNERFKDKLNSNKKLDKFQKIYAFLHEYIHIRNEFSESATEGLLKDAAIHILKNFKKYIKEKYKTSKDELQDILYNLTNMTTLGAARQAAQYGR